MCGPQAVLIHLKWKVAGQADCRQKLREGIMRGIRWAAAAAVYFVLASGLATAQTTLRIGLAEDTDVLDPSLARTYVGRIVFASFCDKLFDIDQNLNVVPQLALSHSTSADGKTVTIKLRPGVKFHDGEPFNAEAAKFSLERHLTMTGSFRKPELAAVDHIDVVDPLTINVVLKSPYSPLIAQFTDRAGMMVSPKAAKEQGDKFGLRPVCAGAYKFVERVQQDRIVFEKFQDYWNKDNVHIDRVIYLPIVDSTVRLANLKSGALDLIERVLATDIKNVRADKNLQLATALELGYQGLDINVGNGDASKNPLGQSAKVSQAMAGEIGINMKIRVTEFATSLKQAEQGNYQAYLLAWSGRTDPDGNTYIFFKCNAPQDSMGYCNADVDKLLDEARVPSELAARKAIYEKLTKTILEDVPKIYLYHRRILIAHTTKLDGYKQMPDGLVRVVGLSLK